MLPILLASTLAVVVGAETYLTAEDHLNHVRHELTPKQKEGVLLYEDLIEEYNKKHGIDHKKSQWHHIPSPPAHGGDEKEPVDIKLFTPNLKAGWQNGLPVTDHKEKHDLKPIKEDVSLSHHKHGHHGNHEKFIENYRRLPESHKHREIEQQHQVLIKPHPLPPYIKKDKQERLEQEQHNKGNLILAPHQHQFQQIVDERLIEEYKRLLDSSHHKHGIQPHAPFQIVRHGEQEGVVGEYKALLHNQHLKHGEQQTLVKQNIPHEQVDARLVDGYGRILNIQQYNNQHQVPLTPHLLSHHDQHEIRHELIQHHNGQHQLPIKPQSLHQKHGQQEVKYGLIDEHGRLLANPEQIQHHNGQHQIPIKPQSLLQHHGQHEVRHGLIDQHGRILTNSEHIQQHEGQHQIPIKPHLLLQHHGQQEVRHGLIDQHGRLLAHSENIQQHNGQHQIPIKPHLLLQHHGQQEVRYGLIDEHGRLLVNPEHGQQHNGQHQIPIKPQSLLHHHSQQEVRHGLIDEHGRLLVKPELIQHHKFSHNQDTSNKPDTPLQHHNQVVHERVIDEYGRIFNNLHHDHQHQIVDSNKDTIKELNRLKELSKEGEHYIRPQFDDHKLRHHELVGYIERLQKDSIAHYNHDERKQENKHHNIREHESRLQYVIEHH